MAKYNELTQGQIEATVNKLGGMEGVQRFLSGKSTVKSVSPFDFKVWKTIGLGTGLVAASNFGSALRSKGQVAYDLSKKMLRSSAFTVEESKREVDLVLITSEELGFKDSATRRDIYERAQELGLTICPPEVGPQLRLQYEDQPCGQHLNIGMEPIEVYSKTETEYWGALFRVEHSAVAPICLPSGKIGSIKEVALGHETAGESFKHDKNKQWVFVKP